MPRRPFHRARVAVVGLLFVSSGAAGAACSTWIGPARTEADYAGKAGTTAKAARSSVEVARIAADTGSGGKAFATYLTVVLSEVEDDVTGVQNTFDKIQPPNETADRQREELDDLLHQATSILSELRIETRRGHLDKLADIAEPLGRLSDQLKQFEDGLP